MKRGVAGRGFYGAGLLLGMFALAEFVLTFLPKLQPLKHLLDVIEIYIHKIHPPLKSVSGYGWLIQAVVAVMLGWLSAFLAIEAFSRHADGVSVWRNIASDSCFRRAPGFRRWLCTATKWLLTVLSGPILILWALLARMRSNTQHVTVGFITIEPALVFEYVKQIAVGAAILVAAAYLIMGDGKAQAQSSKASILRSYYVVGGLARSYATEDLTVLKSIVSQSSRLTAGISGGTREASTPSFWSADLSHA